MRVIGLPWHSGDVAGQDSSDSISAVSGLTAQADLAERRDLRVAKADGLALDLARLSGERWTSSRAGSQALQVAVDAVQPVSDGVFEVWELARRIPLAGKDSVYSVPGQAGAVVVAHAGHASAVARSGSPFLIIVDGLGDAVWRIDTDAVWRKDLDMIVYELFEVSQGRPAVDDSQIPPMPRLPWHRD